MEATFISSNSFSVLGDKTDEFVENRRLKVDCGEDGFKYVKVVSSTFSSVTTVVVDESTLTLNIVDVLYGVVKPGDVGNLPDHFHSNSEGDGGYIEPPPLDFISLTDTPTTYSGTEGLFASSTGSGVSWAEIKKNFIDLNDTPATYSGTEEFFLKSNGDGVVFVDNYSNWLFGYNDPENSFGLLGDYYSDCNYGNLFLKAKTYILNKDETLWSSVYKGTNIVLSEGDLKANSSGGFATALSSIGVTSGKFYWEIYNRIYNSPEYDMSVGIATLDADLNIRLGRDSNGWSYDGDGKKTNSNNSESFGGNYGFTAATIGVALDMDSKKVWFSKDGVWQGGGDPENGLNPAFSNIGNEVFAAYSTNSSWPFGIARFKKESLVYSTPTGFNSGIFRVDETVVWKNMPNKFLELEDTPSTYLNTEGYFSISTGSGIEFQEVQLDKSFLELTDTPTTYSGTEGLYAISTGSGISWSEVKNSFIDLDDTPSTYSGISDRYLRTTESGIEAFDGIIVTSSGGYDWLVKVTDNGILYTEEF
jgi:hypothetical protein